MSGSYATHLRRTKKLLATKYECKNDVFQYGRDKGLSNSFIHGDKINVFQITTDKDDGYYLSLVELTGINKMKIYVKTNQDRKNHFETEDFL